MKTASVPQDTAFPDYTEQFVLETFEGDARAMDIPLLEQRDLPETLKEEAGK